MDARTRHRVLRLPRAVARVRKAVRAMNSPVNVPDGRVDTPRRNTYYPPFDAPSRRCGQVAQLVEHLTENQGVGGSTPSLATKQFRFRVTPSGGPFFMLSACPAQRKSDGCVSRREVPE